MTYTLFLDDERDPVDDASIVCRSFDSAVICVELHGTPTHVDFDHDLGGGETGFDFAKWLIDWALDGNGFPKSYAIHSQNPVGAANIRGVMDGYYRHVKGG